MAISNFFNPIITDGILFISITKRMMEICWNEFMLHTQSI